MFICSECGYKNRHNVAGCLICGNLLQYSTSILSSSQIEVEKPRDKFGIAIPEPDLELTFTIGKGIVSLPFGKGAEVILGRQGQAETDALTPYIDPLHDRLYYAMLKGTPVILREPIEFLSLLPFGADRSGVSRKHAILRHEDHYLTIEDLESTNGTRLNGQRLVPGDKRLLRHGDEILLGGLSLIVTFNREDALIHSQEVLDRLTG